MKVTRSYWLGLGSGFILSAMLTLVISPQQGQAVIPKESSSVSPIKQQPTTQLPAGGAKQADASALNQPSQGQLPNTQSSTQAERQFIIPKGASSEQIANLLVAQGFLKDKESFLVSAHQMGVESQFRAGTFILSLGLTSEELIHRLIK